MFGGWAKYITKSQVRHSTVIITDFNTQGKCVTDKQGKTFYFLFFYTFNSETLRIHKTNSIVLLL